MFTLCLRHSTGDFSGHFSSRSLDCYHHYYYYYTFLTLPWVFNLRPQNTPKNKKQNLLDIESNGIYNAVFRQDAEQTSLVQFETFLFLTCKMLFLWILDKKKKYCCRYFSSPTSGKKSLKPRAVSQHGLRVASRQLAQYCETGGAVDSMLEVFFIIIIVNCLFLYRSKVRVKRINTSYTSMSCTFHIS